MGVVMQVRILWMEKLFRRKINLTHFSIIPLTTCWCFDVLSNYVINLPSIVYQMLILDFQVRIPSKVETPAGSPVKQPQTEVPTSFNYDNHAHMLLF